MIVVGAAVEAVAVEMVAVAAHASPAQHGPSGRETEQLGAGRNKSDSGGGVERPWQRRRDWRQKLYLGAIWLWRGKEETFQRACFEWVYCLQCCRNLGLLG